MIINASDFRPTHELWPDETEAVATVNVVRDPPHVAKGPRGLWYVVQDGNRIPHGHETEAAAEAVMMGMDRA